MTASPLPDVRQGAHGVPLPPAYLTRRARFALAWAGLLDRTHYRRAQDTEHTHFSLRLVAQTRAGLTGVTQWQAGRHKELAIREAQAASALDASPPQVPASRSADELAMLSGRDRLAWAAHNRDTANAEAVRRRQSEARRLAAGELSAIAEELGHLDEEADAARERWQADLHERCMVYGRYRSRRITPAQLYDALTGAL